MLLQRINPVVRHALCLILIQASCVGVGLYMLRHQIAATMQQGDEQTALRSMAREGAAIELLLADKDDRNPDGWNDAELEVIRRELRMSDLPQLGVLLLSREGRVLAEAWGGPASTAADEIAGGTPLVGQLVSGLPRGAGATGHEHAPSSLTSTLVTLGERSYMAHWRPIADSDHSLLLAWPLDGIHAATEARLGSLVAIGAVTFGWIIALLSISVWVVLARIHERSEQLRARSTSDVLKQAQDLVRTRDAVIFGLAKLADSRDEATGDHLERICAYSTALATALRRNEKYGSVVSTSYVRLIGISAALHDIGKVGIEDRILLKPGPLTEFEREKMQLHATIGARCLEEIEQRLGRSNFLQMAREIAQGHHERWDGSGYPNRLAGEAIPLSARIVAIADLYDALVSSRVYKSAFSHEKCVEMIRGLAGTHLDPALVEVFLTVEGRFREIARQFGALAARDAADGSRPVGQRDPLAPPDLLDEISKAGRLAPLPRAGAARPAGQGLNKTESPGELE